MAISLPAHTPAPDAASVSTREPSPLAEGEPPQAAVPAADAPGGIPQSSAPPAGLLHHLDAEEMRRRAAEERNVLDWARWRADAHARIFRVVLGDARSRAGVDVSFAGDDVEGGWRTVAVDAYLRSFIHGAPLPTGPVARDLLRYKVSIVMFDGRGGDSDDAFHAELVKAAATYKKNVDLAGDRTQRSDRAAKLRRLYGPEAAGEGEEALSGVESLARKAHVFTPRSFTGMAADYFNLDEQTPAERTAMYYRYRDAMAEEYGLTTAELEDVLRHRMDAQEHAVSRDALGQVHIKNELMIRGVGEISTAILRSGLTPEEKELLLADLPARFARFKEGVIANVMEQMPEFAREFGIRSVADFNALVSALHEGRAMQAAGGAAVGLGKTAASLEYIGGLFEEKVRLGGLLGKSYLKERSEEIDRRVMVNEQINALSHEFNRAKTTLFGVDAAAIGQGVYSVVETAALAALTGPLAPEIAAVRYGRAAMMFNSASKVAPVAAFMAGRQASATYDDAIRRNFSTDQAEDLALKAGSIGFLTTVLFSAAGAGGVEGIASGAARQALRESLRGTARNALRESLMAGGKGMLGEMAEEQIITALDAALVQAELRPGMTAEDFQRAVYETAVVTFIGSGGFAAAHGKHAYDDTLEGNAQIGERIDVAPASIYPTGDPPPVVDAPPPKKPSYSPDPEKWTRKGGTVDENWTYTDWEGNTVPYPDGFPDFQVGGYVQASVEIVQQGNRTSDFSDATAKNGGVKPPGTIWHHHQNRTTMQAVDIKIHRRFTHKGGVSIKKNSEKP